MIKNEPPIFLQGQWLILGYSDNYFESAINMYDTCNKKTNNFDKPSFLYRDPVTKDLIIITRKFLKSNLYCKTSIIWEKYFDYEETIRSFDFIMTMKVVSWAFLMDQGRIVLDVKQKYDQTDGMMISENERTFKPVFQAAQESIQLHNYGKEKVNSLLCSYFSESDLNILHEKQE